MIGEIVVVIEEFKFNDKLYKVGHQFKIIGSDYLEDLFGNKIYETALMRNKFNMLSDMRDDKLNRLGIK